MSKPFKLSGSEYAIVKTGEYDGRKYAYLELQRLDQYRNLLALGRKINIPEAALQQLIDELVAAKNALRLGNYSDGGAK
jgi:hypothetical protein